MTLPEEYRDLVLDYVASLVPIARELDLWAAELEEYGAWVKEIRETAHKLAGNGASFGFPEITARAKGVTESARRLREEGGTHAELAAAARALARTLDATTV